MKSTMKSAASALLLAPLCFFGVTQTATAKENVPAAKVAAPISTAPKPALWTVKDEDTTIYLFGTIHMLPANQQWLSAPVKAAVESADKLVFEILPPENPAQMAQLTARYALLPNGKTLKGLLSPQEQAKFSNLLAEQNVPLQAMNNLKPWFAATMLSLIPLQKAGFDPNQGVEMQLQAQFSGPNRPMAALETMEQQFQIFDSIPEADQVRYLMESVDQMDEALPLVNAMISHWLKGDADELANLMNESLAATPDFAEALLYDRNEAWAGQLQDMLKQPGTIFVAVGAGHLAGEQSVQDFLKDRGLKVERVAY